MYKRIKDEGKNFENLTFFEFPLNFKSNKAKY